MQALASVDSRRAVRSMLREVSEHNYVIRDMFPPPRTLLVTHQQCARTRVQGTGRDPQVSFSEMTTADAIHYFGLRLKSNRKRVCALNFANGSQVGGGYKTGAQAQEEDLCRRMPGLYTTLFNAKSRDVLYPFGPCTCTSSRDPQKYSDVLWTQDVQLARKAQEDGFAILPHEQQVLVSVVSAAAPNIRFADPPEIADINLMYNTVKAIFIAPAMMQPEVSVLILGAWGCGAFGGNPNDVSGLFCRALRDDGLGRFYEHVHFAVPRAAEKPDNWAIFREALRTHAISVTEISG